MHKIVDPRQTCLFDPYDNVLAARERRLARPSTGGLAGRRREDATEVFHQRYRIRGGIEGTNSGHLYESGNRLGALYGQATIAIQCIWPFS